MSQYFFDVYNDKITHDEEGRDLPDLSAVRKLAMESLPQIAADEIPADGDKQNYIAIARNELGRTVYTATLSYVGLTLPDLTESEG